MIISVFELGKLIHKIKLPSKYMNHKKEVELADMFDDVVDVSFIRKGFNIKESTSTLTHFPYILTLTLDNIALVVGYLFNVSIANVKLLSTHEEFVNTYVPTGDVDISCEILSRDIIFQKYKLNEFASSYKKEMDVVSHLTNSAISKQHIERLSIFIQLDNTIDIMKAFNIQHISSKIVYSAINVPSNVYGKQVIKIHNEDDHLLKVISRDGKRTVIGVSNVRSDNLVLREVQITQPGLIIFNYTSDVTNKQLQAVINDCLTFTNSIRSEIFDIIHINEVLTTPLTNQPVVTLGHYSMTCDINTSITEEKLQQLHDVIVLRNTQLKVSSNTTIRYRTFGYICPSRLHYADVMLKTRQQSYNSENFLNEVMPEVYVQIESKHKLRFTITGVYDERDALDNFRLCIGLLGSSIKDELTQESTSELTIQSIRAKYNAIGSKQLLNILRKTDPKLFGVRHNRGKTRAYSTLCQKHEQRPVCITHEEYSFIKPPLPLSVIDIENQAYPGSRLYLFAADPRNPVINFHLISTGNQLPIVRCTCKLINASQRKHCAQILKSSDKMLESKHESRNVSLFQDWLGSGKRCELPPELINYLPNHILWNPAHLSLVNDMDAFLEDKGLPLVISRVKDSRYYDIESDCIANNKYYLFIKVNKGIYAVIDRNDDSLYEVTDVLFNLLSSSGEFVDTTQGFFKPLNVSVIGSLEKTLKACESKGIKFVRDNNMLIGAVINGIGWSLPNMPYTGNIKCITSLDNTQPPSLQDVEKYYDVSKVYKDYNSGKIFACLLTDGTKIRITDCKCEHSCIYADSTGLFKKLRTSVKSTSTCRNRHLICTKLWDVYNITHEMPDTSDLYNYILPSIKVSTKTDISYVDVLNIYISYNSTITPEDLRIGLQELLIDIPPISKYWIYEIGTLVKSISVSTATIKDEKIVVRTIMY